jgi:alpha-L-rhamnosidase
LGPPARKRLAVLFSLIQLLLLHCDLVAAQTEPSIQPWPAQWITCPDAPERDAFVFHFRKVLELPQKPAHFLVHISADNQFLLHVNQQRIGTGPARGDLAHWRFESYDLAPYLHAGRNTLAATVWGFGTRSAYAQISDRAGFLLHGDGPPESAADTNETWQVEQDTGLQAPFPTPEVSDFYGAEPGERIDAQTFDWQWDADPAARDHSSPVTGSAATGAPTRAMQWKNALPIDSAVLRGGQLQTTNWQLVPDPLPPMARELISAGKVVRISGLEAGSSFPVDLCGPSASPGVQASPQTPNQNCPSRNKSDTPPEFPDKAFAVPAHSKVTLLLDVSHLTTGYPELTVTGGRGASIRETYAEALINEQGQKGNRNEIAGKHIVGLSDEFLPDGSANRTFMPLAWRAWRYLQLDISTADEPLQLDHMRTWFTAYPFEERGYFHSDDPSLAAIWDIGWRTARLDAHDTYMDTPYWERLQYVGDTRIQALISYMVAGDDRLARQAIQSFNNSRIPDGITQSRYPSNTSQYIPTFSLLWIGMLHDFWLYRGDPDFVRLQLPGTRTVLDWFRQYQRRDGLLKKLPWWPFVDWAKDFTDGVPPQDKDGGSVPITLQYIEALRYAAELETAYGDRNRAAEYQIAAARAAQTIHRLCWNQKNGLLADTPAQTHFSQHANLLAVWLDVIPKREQKTVLAKILSADRLPGKQPPSERSESTPSSGEREQLEPLPPISKATYYFRFYLARAIDHADMGDAYLSLLQPWRDMAAEGLSTWAETPEPTRSDSHAWSAHPNFDLLTIVAGIRPKTTGFRSVTIEPKLGTLHHVAASAPTPNGDITVEYTRENAGVRAVITLPPQISGNLVWNGKTYQIHPGQQQFALPQ